MREGGNGLAATALPQVNNLRQPFVAYATKDCIAFSPPFLHAPAMQPKTEEFLNLLLWSADLLARPTFRNLTDSYESWAYRNGLLRQVATLEQQQLLERDTKSPDDRALSAVRAGAVARPGRARPGGTLGAALGQI